MIATEKIKRIAEPILETNNLFLVDLSVSKDNVITVFIDAVTGVDINTCIRVSKELEQHLNREEEDFELTVSSAGIGYPFKVAGQYQKNIGKRIEVKLKDNTRLEGILKAFDEQAICLELEEKTAVEGKKKKELLKTEKIFKHTDIALIKDIITF